MSARSLGQLYRTALVTGASSGLGRGFADMLLADGVRVWGTARDPARLPARPNFTACALDLADAAGAEAAFRAAEREAGGFELVVNNAGYGVFGPFADTDFSRWSAQLDVLLTATMRLSHLALAGMKARNHGCLVNVSSLAAELPLPFMSAYNTAKAGLSAFTDSLAMELAPTAVKVLDFRPGDHRTDFNQAMQSHSANPSADARLPRVWAVLERNLQAGPLPAHAAADLRRALLRGRRGTVRTGDWFQARLAPLFVRLAPSALRRAVLGWYFKAL